jgi:hypothetical protein
MRRVFLALFMASFAAGLLAQSLPDPSKRPGRVHHYPPRGAAASGTKAGGQNLTYFGGPVLPLAKAVFIFWGPSFSNVASPDYQYAQELIAFRNQLGTAPEYNTITQYYQTVGGGNQFIQLTNLAGGSADWFDISPPPTNVSDAAVRAEVQLYLTTHTVDYSTVYEVFLPSTSYSTSGSRGSCGAPSLGYCAYHSYYGSGATAVKYSIEPYPSCNGCRVSGWTAAQNQEHFVVHETREAVTDPLINAWLDRSGAEADDKCAWSPTPFIGTGGYGYQYEWSNANGGCVKTR